MVGTLEEIRGEALDAALDLDVDTESSDDSVFEQRKRRFSAVLDRLELEAVRRFMRENQRKRRHRARLKTAG